jgi:hypothetical protein
MTRHTTAACRMACSARWATLDGGLTRANCSPCRVAAMRVRFARWFAAMLTVVGAVATLLGVALAVNGSGAAIPVLGGGGVMLVFGLLCFGPMPYVVVSPSQVELSMTRGPHKRTPIRGHERLNTDGERLFIVGDGGDVKRLPIYRSMSHPDDWTDLVATFGRR